MKAFLRKEAIELAWPVGTLFIAACTTWLIAVRFDELLIAPNFKSCLVITGIATAIGAVLAFVQFAAERWRGTIGFAVHRAGAHAAVFAAKTLVGVPATIVLALGPIFVFAGWHALFSPNAAVMQSDRLLEYTVFASSGISGYALGALASQVRRSWWLDACVLVFGAFTVFVLSMVAIWSVRASLVASIAVVLLVQALMFVSLSSLALKLMRGARDREQLFPNSQIAALAGLYLVFLVLPASILIGGAAEFARHSVLVQYPAIVQDRNDGNYRVLDRFAREIVGRTYMGDDHQRKTQAPVADIVYWPATQRLPDRRQVEEFEMHVLHGSSLSTLLPRWDYLFSNQSHAISITHEPKLVMVDYLDRQQGSIRVFWTEVQEQSALAAPFADKRSSPRARQQVLTKPNGGRFSPSSIIAARDQDACCLIDFDDKTIWQVASTELDSAIVELQLPDHDSLARVEPLYSRAALGVGAFMRFRDDLLFVGEQGKYMWRRDGFQAYSGNLLPASHATEEPVPSSVADKLCAIQVRQTDFDPLEPAVEIRDGSGERTLFSYRYSPSTTVAAAMLQAIVLLRPSITCVNSFADEKPVLDETDFASAAIKVYAEPLLAQGRRPWLLVLNLAIAGICAYSIARRMRRLHAGRVTTVLVTAIVALFGLLAYVFFRGLVPSHPAPPTGDTPALESRALLIQSA